MIVENDILDGSGILVFEIEMDFIMRPHDLLSTT